MGNSKDISIARVLMMVGHSEGQWKRPLVVILKKKRHVGLIMHSTFSMTQYELRISIPSEITEFLQNLRHNCIRRTDSRGKGCTNSRKRYTHAPVRTSTQKIRARTRFPHFPKFCSSFSKSFIAAISSAMDNLSVFIS